MWYLLVAAGAGYLATKWQNGQKLQLGCGQNGRTSPPSSPLGTPKREFSASLSNSMPTSPDVVHDLSLGFDAARQKSSMNGFLVRSDREVASSPQEIKSSKRNACEALLINPTQVEREDPLVYTSKCSFNGAVSIDDEEERQLKEESSSSPSSCCSSNSTVINSPVDNQSILRYDGAFKFQGKEQGSQPMQPSVVFHFHGKEKTMQFGTLPNQTTAPPANIKLERDSLRDVERENPRNVVRESSTDVERECSSDASVITIASQHADGGCEEKSLFGFTFAAPKSNVTALASPYAASVTHSSRMLDAGIHTPLSFTGKRLRDDTRADPLPDDLLHTHISKSDEMHGNSQMAVPTNGSLLPPCHSSIASQRALDNMGNVDSDAFVSFGLAMAVCFMVSSGKQEMEKMGKVLTETEDLVSDMRRELEERKLRSCMDEEDNDEFFTIKTNGEQECMTGTVVDCIDTVCKKYGPRVCDDECVRSDVIDVAARNRLCVFDTEENYELGGTRSNAERSDLHMKRGTTNGELQNAYCDYGDESDVDEAGDTDCTMSMIELERKLWQVLQERQEERISELEEALELAFSKLHAKEEELRWWKNRASWLMEQSFGSTSGEPSTRNRVKRVEGSEGAHPKAVNFDS